MNIHHSFTDPRLAERNDTRRLRSIGARIAAWLRTCATYYDAATTYEQLSRLSDAELARRGLDRATLARDVCQESEDGNVR
jgi:hypothetical protein